MATPKDYALALATRVGIERARVILLLEATRVIHDSEGNITWKQDKPEFWLAGAQALVVQDRALKAQARQSKFTLSAREQERAEARAEYALSQKRMAGYRDTTLLDG